MTIKLRPHEHPAAISLTAFRDSLVIQGPFYNSAEPLFNTHNHAEPAQARILRAIQKDLSRNGNYGNQSFSPEGVLRGVRTQQGKVSRKDLFGVVAKEVARADLPWATRWYAVASAAHQGVFNQLVMSLPPQPESDKQIKQVADMLRRSIIPASENETTVLVTLGMDGQHKLVKQYLSSRPERLSIYMTLVHTLTIVLVQRPQIKDSENYETKFLPALKFYCSNFRKKEDYLQTPNIDLFKSLLEGKTLPDGRYMAQEYSEEQVHDGEVQELTCPPLRKRKPVLL